MDEMVLAAQEWVNTTYGDVPGYVACREDGKTAWSVMYSLTRALQHEIGITALSDNFGPTTLATLAARGGVTSSEPKANIVKIVQAAFWCKGYNPGLINGVFADSMGAMSRMALDLGTTYQYGDPLTPKFVKALLTMDAYVIVQGGTQPVRSVQQWLNSRYINRRDFYYVPCDGNFSRDVQKAFLKAVQFELGVSDDNATGTFGPTTQAGLRAHPINVGDTGVWVRLFTAAMVFNGYGSFSETFSSTLSSQLQSFQSFTALPVSGVGNFATWAELLVSTGDPSRPGIALDTATPLTPATAASTYAAGYRYVGRYLDNVDVPNARNKKIQPGELQTIFAAGMRVFPIQQYSNNSLTMFTYARGKQDAIKAHDRAVSYGMGQGTVIYFAVDYDATQVEIDSNIIPYFEGVVAGLRVRGKRYLHGVYGSRNVCQNVSEKTFARWSFVLGMSTGYSGNLGFRLPENWAFNQIQTLTVGSGSGSIEIDKNVHKPGTDTGVAVVNAPQRGVAEFVAHVDQVYALAHAYDASRADLLTLQYLRDPAYTDIKWTFLYGAVDRDFIRSVEVSGLEHFPTYRDPFWGVDIQTDHLAASTNAHLLVSQPAGSDVNGGDFGGWGGDLTTFYAEWRDASDSFASGEAFCNDRLMSTSKDSTFKLRDAIEDADAYLMANRIRTGVGNVAQVFRSHLLGETYQTRFWDFINDRFGGSTQTIQSVARTFLTTLTSNVAEPREALIQATAKGVAPPAVLPDELLDGFTSGFANKLWLLGASEVMN